MKWLNSQYQASQKRYTRGVRQEKEVMKTNKGKVYPPYKPPFQNMPPTVFH